MSDQAPDDDPNAYVNGGIWQEMQDAAQQQQDDPEDGGK